MPIGDVIELELAQPPTNGANGAPPRAGRAPIVIVDDAERIDEAGAQALRKASSSGARLVVVGPRSAVAKMVCGEQVAFVVPPLEAARRRRSRPARRAFPARGPADAPRRAHGRTTGGAPRGGAPPRGPGDRLEGRGRRGARRPRAPARAVDASVAGGARAGSRRGRTDARHGPIRRRGARPRRHRRPSRQRRAGAPGDGAGPDRDWPG